MTKYITRQRKIFLGYLAQHPDEPLTARQIADALHAENISISAVYRNLCELEAEGRIRRTSRSGSREVYYQYAGTDECKMSLHLSCKKCGKTFHMGMPCANLIIQNIAENEKFAIDKTDTVIYGLCEGCQECSEGRDAYDKA